MFVFSSDHKRKPNQKEGRAMSHARKVDQKVDHSVAKVKNTRKTKWQRRDLNPRPKAYEGQVRICTFLTSDYIVTFNIAPTTAKSKARINDTIKE